MLLHLVDLGAVSLTTQRTQRKTLRCVRTLRNACNATSCCMARIGLQCTKWRYSKLLFCLFFREKKRRPSPPKTKAIHFGQEILVHTRDERGEFSLFNVQTRPRIISSQLPVLPSLIVLLSEIGPATATIRSVKRRHVIGQTLRCLREIRTWVQLLSCVACVVLLA